MTLIRVAHTLDNHVIRTHYPVWRRRNAVSLPLKIDAPVSWHTQPGYSINRAGLLDLCQFPSAFSQFSCSVRHRMRPVTAGLAERIAADGPACAQRTVNVMRQISL